MPCEQAHIVCVSVLSACFFIVCFAFDKVLLKNSTTVTTTNEQGRKSANSRCHSQLITATWRSRVADGGRQSIARHAWPSYSGAASNQATEPLAKEGRPAVSTLPRYLLNRRRLPFSSLWAACQSLKDSSMRRVCREAWHRNTTFYTLFRHG